MRMLAAYRSWWRTAYPRAPFYSSPAYLKALGIGTDKMPINVPESVQAVCLYYVNVHGRKEGIKIDTMAARKDQGQELARAAGVELGRSEAGGNLMYAVLRHTPGVQVLAPKKQRRNPEGRDGSVSGGSS